MFVDELIDPRETFHVTLTGDEQLLEQIETRASWEFRLIYCNLSIDEHRVDMRQLIKEKMKSFYRIREKHTR